MKLARKWRAVTRWLGGRDHRQLHGDQDVPLLLRDAADDGADDSRSHGAYGGADNACPDCFAFGHSAGTNRRMRLRG